MVLIELVMSATAALGDWLLATLDIAGAAAVDGDAVTYIVLSITVVTVTIEHAPSPEPGATFVAAALFAPPAPFAAALLANSTVTVLVEVEVSVKVVPWSFDGIEAAATFAGATELIARELAPAAKLAGAADVSAAAAVELCM